MAIDATNQTAHSRVEGEPRTHHLLEQRWSPTIFDPGHQLAEEEITRLLQAAEWAPSANNTQPWAFVVCRRGDANHRELLPLLSRGNAAWVPMASAVLLGLAQIAAGPEADAPTYSAYAEYDAGQAVAHLSLQARAQGLETHQFAGFDHDGARAAFSIPPHFKVMAGIAVGVPGSARVIAGAAPELRLKEGRPRERRPARLFVAPR